MEYQYSIIKIDKNTNVEYLQLPEPGIIDFIYTFNDEKECLKKIEELKNLEIYKNYILQLKEIYYY